MKEKNVPVMSAERIMTCVREPIVVAAGEYPKVVLQPTRLNEDFLELIEMLGFPKLEKNMTLTRFKTITKLNLNHKTSQLI